MKRGAPIGNTNATKSKAWHAALDTTLRDYGNPNESKAEKYWVLKAIAKKLIDMNVLGEVDLIALELLCCWYARRRQLAMAAPKPSVAGVPGGAR